MYLRFYIPIQEEMIAEAKVYALYDAHEKFGDTRNNRKNNAVNLIKEREIIKSIKDNTDLWWKTGVGFCEDNPAFSKNLKVFNHENNYYLNTIDKNIYVANKFKTKDVFKSKKALKNHFKSEFDGFKNEDIKFMIEFWKNNPNGIAIIE